MKHVLIPTDFTISSLQLIHAVVKHFKGERIRICLFHLLEPQSGIQDMLFRSNRIDREDFMTGDFENACEIIGNKYQSTIASLKIEFATGTTAAFLENAFEGLGIDMVFIPENYKMNLGNRRSVNVLPLLRRTRYPVVAIPSADTWPLRDHSSITNLLITSN